MDPIVGKSSTFTGPGPWFSQLCETKQEGTLQNVAQMLHGAGICSNIFPNNITQFCMEIYHTSCQIIIFHNMNELRPLKGMIPLTKHHLW